MVSTRAWLALLLALALAGCFVIDKDRPGPGSSFAPFVK